MAEKIDRFQDLESWKKAREAEKLIDDVSNGKLDNAETRTK